MVDNIKDIKDERGNNNKGRVFTKVEDKRGDRNSTKQNF